MHRPYELERAKGARRARILTPMSGPNAAVVVLNWNGLEDTRALDFNDTHTAHGNRL